MSAARAAEAFPPALLEKRPQASVLRRIHLHETNQRQRVTHATPPSRLSARERIESPPDVRGWSVTKEDFAAKGEAYDVIFVAVDKGRFPDCMRALKRKGIYLNATTPVRTLPMRWAALTSGKTIVTGEHPSEKADDLVFVKGLIEEGALRSAIDRRYPLERIVEAHRYVDQGHKKGNVVIAVE